MEDTYRFAQEAIPQVKRWQRSAHVRIFARTSELAEVDKPPPPLSLSLDTQSADVYA